MVKVILVYFILARTITESVDRGENLFICSLQILLQHTHLAQLGIHRLGESRGVQASLPLFLLHGCLAKLSVISLKRSDVRKCAAASHSSPARDIGVTPIRYIREVFQAVHKLLRCPLWNGVLCAPLAFSRPEWVIMPAAGLTEASDHHLGTSNYAIRRPKASDYVSRRQQAWLELVIVKNTI